MTSKHKAFKKKTKASSDVSGLKRSSSKVPNPTVTSSLPVVASTAGGSIAGLKRSSSKVPIATVTASLPAPAPLSVVASTATGLKIASSNKEWNQLAKNNLISYNGENNWKILTTEPHTSNNNLIPNAIKIGKRGSNFVIIKKNNYRKVNGSSAAPAAAPETGKKAVTTGAQFALNPNMLAKAKAIANTRAQAKLNNNDDDNEVSENEWSENESKTKAPQPPKQQSNTNLLLIQGLKGRRSAFVGNASGTGAPALGFLAGIQGGLQALKTLTVEEQAEINAKKKKAEINAKKTKIAGQGGVPSFAEAAQEKAHALHEAAAAAAAANEVVANGTKIIYHGSYEDFNGRQAEIIRKVGPTYKIKFNNTKKTIIQGVTRNQFIINNSVVASSSNETPPTNPRIAFTGSGTGSKPQNYGYGKASANHAKLIAQRKANAKTLQNAAKALQNAENAKLKLGDLVMQKNGTDPIAYRFLRNDATNPTKIIISKPHKEPGKYLGSFAPSTINHSSVNRNLYVKVPPHK